jgi:hypothetical protein
MLLKIQDITKTDWIYLMLEEVTPSGLPLVLTNAKRMNVPQMAIVT